MKLKLSVMAVLAIFATNTFAEKNTISLGYAQTKVEDSIDLKGFNLTYRYALSEPLSILASASYQSGDEKSGDEDGNGELDVKYMSILAGPAFRLNDFFSIYALGGFAQAKIKDHFLSENEYDNYNAKETTFAYGAGVIVNPTPTLSVNVGYEGTTIDSAKFNGFNIGVGYSF